MDSSCSLNDWPSEAAVLILRDCSKAKEVWSYFLHHSQHTHFFSADF